MILACNVGRKQDPKGQGATSWLVAEDFTGEAIYGYNSCHPRPQSFGLPCKQSQAKRAALCKWKWWLAGRKRWLPFGLELTDTRLSDAEEALWNAREVSHGSIYQHQAAACTQLSAVVCGRTETAANMGWNLSRMPVLTRAAIARLAQPQSGANTATHEEKKSC